ncbi:tyrosine-type recombinase/integrase [Duganella sp. FT109W]|uniref:Tyrosine-type recombinase/integrase n=1 Tax=Duganella margarita TaxID=2692170 RepID=A0ABW9WRK3_9BURK|nr:site-specific integrase [Duganella margarita]MYN42755.1 tyrosine-type recombinase/integrase [Duganella margarita]
MASFTRTAKGWRAAVAVRGTRDTKTFTTKAEAVAWAAARETQIRQGESAPTDTLKTLDEAFHRYLKEVSVHKRGHRMEGHRLAAIADHVVGGRRLGSLPLSEVSSDVLGQWRDLRLRGTFAANFADKVKGASVIRELNLLSHVFTTARREWKWIVKSPTTDVRRPKGSAPRDRRISEDEIDRLCVALGFDESPVTTRSGVVAVAFLFAIETGMRAGEICGLRRDDIKGRVAHLPRTKNGTKRDVPLSTRALELIALMPAGDAVFDITAASLDALFRKAKARCQIDDLKFHDTRHEAITRLAKRLNVLELARVVGHRNLNELQTYYNETAEELSKKLQ